MDAPRVVTLVIVDSAGELHGSLPAFEAELPYWQEAADVVRIAASLYGAQVVVLRLLKAEQPQSPGGAVTYLAELDVESAERLQHLLSPVGETIRALALGRDGLRAVYAEVGGPAESLAWAAKVLGGLVAAEQQRTWNLSSLWRLTAKDGRRAWLKQVPGFFGHESVVLGWLNDTVPELAPPLLAVGPSNRQLLADVPGRDLYDADTDTCIEIVRQAHRLQLKSLTDLETLVAAGVPDRRGPALVGWIHSTLEHRIGAHPACVLMDTLEDRFADLDACGLPDTLVHGDAHGGNVRAEGERMVFLDWGDSLVGHPAFDAITLTRSSGSASEVAVSTAWSERWRASVPGCDPERALALIRPIASLRSAAVYADFLDRIEESESPYHRGDVPFWLDRAAEQA